MSRPQAIKHNIGTPLLRAASGCGTESVWCCGTSRGKNASRPVFNRGLPWEGSFLVFSSWDH